MVGFSASQARAIRMRKAHARAHRLFRIEMDAALRIVDHAAYRMAADAASRAFCSRLAQAKFRNAQSRLRGCVSAAGAFRSAILES